MNERLERLNKSAGFHFQDVRQNPNPTVVDLSYALGAVGVLFDELGVIASELNTKLTRYNAIVSEMRGRAEKCSDRPPLEEPRRGQVKELEEALREFVKKFELV